MADYGLLGALGEGLKAGLSSYQSERDYQQKQKQAAEEKALKQRLAKINELDSYAKFYDLTGRTPPPGYFSPETEAAFAEKPASGLLEDPKQDGLLQQPTQINPNLGQQDKGLIGNDVIPVNALGVGQSPMALGPMGRRQREGYEKAQQMTIQGAEKGLMGGYNKQTGLPVILQAPETENMRLTKEEKRLGVDKAKLGIKAAQLEPENKLRDEYNTQTKNAGTETIMTGYNKVLNGVKQNSAAGDMSVVYGVVKMQDPTSSVREGEYATAENTRGLSDEIRSIFNKVKDGRRLTPQQRQDFLATANSLLQGQLQTQGQIDSRYTELAKRGGMNPKNVIRTFNYEQLPKESLAAPEDQQALDWAKKNPNDPRSVKILQKLGVK